MGFYQINEQVWNDDYILDKCQECSYIQTRKNLPEELLIKENYYVSKYQAIQEHDLLFVKDLSIEDGAATLTEFTADIIITKMLMDIDKIDKPIDVYAPTTKDNIYICGGGRKNQFLIERIKFCSLRSNTKHKINIIDDLGVDGDFIESQAFGYLAIRSYLGLPISFPETTGCIKPCTGGVIIKNY